MTAFPLLTTASRIQCAHGAPAQLVTANVAVSAGGARVLLESDVHAVQGCPFTVGNKPSPCVRIEWSSGAQKASLGDEAPLLKTSMGECKNAEGATQGVALIVNTQTKAVAR